MKIVAYYEGGDDVGKWLRNLLGFKPELRKLPSRNDSSDFSQLPAYVADILYLDKPDIILSGSSDGIHERPIASIEFASCTPQYQHALQRFSRMMASVMGGCPSVIIIPMRKNENMGGGRQYARSRAVEYGAVRLMDTYRIPAFVFDWPDKDGNLLNNKNTNYPSLASKSMKDLGSFLKSCITAFDNLDYLGTVWRLPAVRALLDQTRVRAYSGGAPTISRPGGGTGEDSLSKLELIATTKLFKQISSKHKGFSKILEHTPDFISRRNKSLVFYPTRITAHAGDPYVGMIGYYDIAFCRNGPSTRDRSFNLVAWADEVSIDEVEGTMKKFHSKTCPFSKTSSKSKIVSYCYHLKYGCKLTKIKPVRIYAELADILIFNDGILFNVG